MTPERLRELRAKANECPNECHEFACMEVRELIDEVERHQRLLAEAAQEINCAGPVAHRIRIMKAEHGKRVERLEARVDAANKITNTFHDYLHGLAELEDVETAVERYLDSEKGPTQA